MTTTETRQVLFVVGMHRCGTSALCAALQACGVEFGEHLLAPLGGVNDEGFWEDRRVVELNEQLLAELGHDWYTVSAELVATDWTDQRFSAQRAAAQAVLEHIVGNGSVSALKDPRFCITLPFWLHVSSACGIDSQVCVINRAPLEVARSLEKRDGFPVGFGLRLYLVYWQVLSAGVPADAVYLAYDQLLQDPEAVIAAISARVPLVPDSEALARAVRNELRHQRGAGDDLLGRADSAVPDLVKLAVEIEARYPVTATLQAFGRSLVERSLQLMDLGEDHAGALSTIDERDAQIDQLGEELRQALAVIAERDMQISEFDRRLEELGEQHAQALAVISERDGQVADFDRRLTNLGEEHTHALSVIQERDGQISELDGRLSTLGAEHTHAQAVVAERDRQLREANEELRVMHHRLERILKLPGLGLVFRKLWFYEKG